MKLKTLLFRALLLMLVAAGVAQYLLYQRAQDEAKRVAAQFLGYGQLRYERVWANLWGTARASNLSFEPTGFTQAMLHTPLGYRASARELRIERLRLNEDGGARLIEGSLLGISVPVVDARSALSPAAFAGLALPSLAEMGYTELALDIDFSLRFLPEAELVLLKLKARGRNLADIVLDAQIEGDGVRFRTAPDQIGLRKLRLEYTDTGLTRSLKDVMAARSRVSVPSLEQSLIAQLDQRAKEQNWKWDAATAQAVRRFIRESGQATVLLDPPGQLVLRNLPLYAVGDRPQLLGFSFAVPGS